MTRTSYPRRDAVPLPLPQRPQALSSVHRPSPAEAATHASQADLLDHYLDSCVAQHRQAAVPSDQPGDKAATTPATTPAYRLAPSIPRGNDGDFRPARRTPRFRPQLACCKPMTQGENQSPLTTTNTPLKGQKSQTKRKKNGKGSPKSKKKEIVARRTQPPVIQSKAPPTPPT